MKRTAFLLDVSDQDIVDVWFDVDAGRVAAFTVNYRAFVPGEWQEVIRYDTSHGKLHVHEFWPAGQERIVILEGERKSDYTAALEEAMGDLEENWTTYRRKAEESK